MALAANWPAPPQVDAWVTLRRGGVSEGDYASLNLGSHVGDDPAAVAENRCRVAAALQLPAEPAWMEQLHGTRVLDLDTRTEAGSGAADAAVTGTAGAVCVVLTADCLPVLLTDRGGTRVGAAHAGWRGLVQGVLPAAVAALEAPPETLLAWLGPAIGPTAFEVGGEVRAAFAAAGFAVERSFTPNVRGRWQADLYALATESLASAGVTAVFGGGFCTYSDRDRFFSHRRAAPCGRMAALIWLS